MEVLLLCMSFGQLCLPGAPPHGCKLQSGVAPMRAPELTAPAVPSEWWVEQPGLAHLPRGPLPLTWEKATGSSGAPEAHLLAYGTGYRGQRT